MTLTRRTWLQGAAGATLAAHLATPATRLTAAESKADMLIIDTHQHLWDLEKLKLPWLGGAPEVLKRSYRPEDYAAATSGYNVKSIYMEVDVDPTNHDAEADYVVGLSQRGQQMIGAVIGGRPASAQFDAYLERHAKSGKVKGVRQVLHVPETPAGFSLQDNFVRGVQLLGKRGMSFDLCMRPTELSDAAKLVAKCPDTRFVVDHCGNADPKAFNAKLAPSEERWHDAETWKRDVVALAKLPNVIMKISGIIARAPQGWQVDDLAVIVNHCLDTFGPDRVVFGGDWPVCLLGAPLRSWIDSLLTIIGSRSADDQQKLLSKNAIRLYGVKV